MFSTCFYLNCKRFIYLRTDVVEIFRPLPAIFLPYVEKCLSSIYFVNIIVMYLLFPGHLIIFLETYYFNTSVLSLGSPG